MAAPAGHAPLALGFSDGQLEAVKWLALASMVVDHVGRHLLGHGHETWVFALGRLAFPLFAFVLGMNLARAGERGTRALRTTARLALWCGVAVLPSIWARGDPATVNVLATLGLGALLCWAVDGRGPLALRLLVCLVAPMAAWWAEFGPAGTLLVTAVYLAATRRDPALWLPAALLLGAVTWLNASFGGMWGLAGTLAAVPAALLLRALPAAAPRWPLVFYLGYPLHLAVIGWLKGSIAPGIGTV